MNKVVQNPQLMPIYFTKDNQTPLQPKDGRVIITTRSKIRMLDGSICDGYRQEYSYTMEELTMLMHINVEAYEGMIRSCARLRRGINLLHLKVNQKQYEIKQLSANIIQNMEDLSAQRQEILQTVNQYLAGTLEGTGSKTKLILDTLNGHKEELEALHAELTKITGKN